MDTTVSVFLQSLLAFSLLFTAVWVIKTVFKKHMSALVQYLLWIIVIAKLLVPVGLESEASPWNLLIGERTQTVQQPTAPASSLSSVMYDKTDTPEGMQGDLAAVAEQAQQQNVQTVQAVVPAPAPEIKWDWKVIAFMGWISGTLAMLIWMLASSVRIRRQLSRNYVGQAPDWVVQIFEESRRELKVRRHIRLTVQRAFPIPAIMGLIRPMLILPVQILREENTKRLRHIVLHELTHYKNGDIPVTLLLNLLNAVYWFNPLVWMLVRLVRCDMETLCDNRVIAQIGKDQRQEYIRTILQFAFVRPVLNAAMSINDGRIPMQKRIQGMFIHKKMGIGVRIPVLLLCCAIVFVCFTTGCQPTPERPVVVNKNDSALSDSIKATPAPEAAYSAPASVKDAFTAKDSQVTVNIDAAVTVPKVSAFPVIQIQPDEFTKDFVKKAAGVLFEGKTAYEPRTQMTKAEIEKEILELQHALADPKNSGSDGLMSGDAETVAATTQMFNDRIKNYQALLATAPEKVTAKESDFQFHPAKTYEDPAMYKELNDELKKSGGDNQSNELLDVNENTQKLIADATLDNGYYGRIEVSNYNGSTMMDNSLYFLKSNTLHPNIRLGPTYGFTAKLPTTSLSQDDAFRMSQDLLNRLGIADMALTSCSTITSDSMILNTVSHLGRSETSGQQPDEKCGYCLTYRRTYGGIPTIAGNSLYENGGDIRLSYDNQYGPYYQHEYIQITIYGDQIISFIWRSPSKEVQTENANVELKPFKDIMDAFKQQMSVEYTLEKLAAPPEILDNGFRDKAAANIKSGHVDISKIGLEMVRIQIKDKPGEYRMVPAWRFYGNVKIQWKDSQEEEQTNTEGDRGKSLTVYQTINAIDGSVIDEKLGY